MHEWALAKSVIDTTIEIKKEKGYGPLKKVVVGIGELQDIDIEIFSTAVEGIKRETELKDTHFEFRIERAILKCNNCGNEWFYRDTLKKLGEVERENIHFIPETVHIYIKCPRCGSVDFELKSGRGVFIYELE